MVEGASLLVGVKVTLNLSAATVRLPTTRTSLLVCTKNVDPVIVRGLMRSLNCNREVRQ